MILPEEFVNSMRALMSGELYATLEKGLQELPPVSIRLNPLKRAGMTVTEGLADGSVPWSRDGIYLKERPNFTFDPLLHAGVYYVQEAASMFIQHVLHSLGIEDREPMTVLDLCAAPGGKSAAVRAMLPEGSLLISNEPMRQRAQILAENIQKFGHTDVIVTNNYASDIAKTGVEFDLIVCDVPCSGEGMFRKDEGAIGEWSLQNVERCRILQREIVSDIWDSLRPGGILIYSTCTFNVMEDEENVQWIASDLGAETVEVPVDESWNITGALVGDSPVYRFIPGKTRGEGLFMAVLRKSITDGCSKEKSKGKDDRKRKKDRNVRGGNSVDYSKTVGEWLTAASACSIIQNGDDILAIPKAWEHVYNNVRNSLKVVHAGVKIGQCKGKNLIPDQSLALSASFNTGAFPKVDVTYGQAIAYLRKEAVTMPEGTPRGFVLLTYNNVPIGFVKNIGNRANNLYPQEWKIKSTHVPEAQHVITNN